MGSEGVEGDDAAYGVPNQNPTNITIFSHCLPTSFPLQTPVQSDPRSKHMDQMHPSSQKASISNDYSYISTRLGEGQIKLIWWFVAAVDEVGK